MANTFKNAYLDVTSSAQDLYTAPGSTTSIVLTLRVTNVDGTASDDVSVEIVDSDTTTKAFIASTLAVPADSSVEIAGTSKIVLEAGDKIQVTGAAASGDLEVFASILEIT
tara:strand:- start:396 stop:728 length:333 start_codon:yes stop_codon:yes gene_type:complete